ncbi:mechanosensitive ion channel family protein [Kaistella jeonii]|uniref:Mechanosensitive ion channel protein MscS n=1 Tax=Kaistella jeonii TaxID=266749 RepID=A0A0C1CV45_9FLAO|nr:mechanosensitive ion channel domain-containing protein [Kaistella jeonii]KIA88166.1 mechanosensitive ion channel protein MscS [Kaistella jeonii]SFC29805.1 small conductance mechanosensitive channel [Kaistella jeonii]VEI96870.1 Small-conductance mechanosensitive channel [Kaistella jeonii]
MNYYETILSVLDKWYKGFAEATPRIAVGILVFLLFLALSSFLSKISVRIFHKFFPKSKNRSVVALIKVFKFLIILSGAFISLEIMGMGGFVLKFIGSLGVAGVVAGVALKDLVSSMFSGALVGIDKSFADGDYVSIKDVTGVVEKIGFLTTKIITDEGKKVFVPNQLIFSAPFINYSASGQRKVFLDLQIASDQDLEKTTKVILDEIKTFDATDHIDEAQVIILKQSFGIFYLQARFFMKKGENIAKVKSDALLKLKNKLEESGIKLATQIQIDPST